MATCSFACRHYSAHSNLTASPARDPQAQKLF